MPDSYEAMDHLSERLAADPLDNFERSGGYLVVVDCQPVGAWCELQKM